MPRVIALLLAVVGAAFLFLGAAWASDAYEVRGVEVDETAKTAAEARRKALVQGEAKALTRLFERLTLSADKDRLPVVDPNDVKRFVKDFGVSDEKSSAVRYIATLNYRFNPDAVRNLLRDWDLPFAETFSKPLLVLPVFEEKKKLTLWDEPNPWRDAWSAQEKEKGLVPTVLPLGDLTDIGAVSARQAAKGDVPRLAAIASRYGTTDTLVAMGVLKRGEKKRRHRLEVYLTRYGASQSDQTVIKTFNAKADTPVEDFLATTVDSLIQLLEDNWKRDNLLRFGRPAIMSVNVPIVELRDWIALRGRLEDAAVIRHVDLVMMSLNEARLNLHYYGDPDQLSLTLGQSDLSLAREGSEWVLRLADSGAGR